MAEDILKAIKDGARKLRKAELDLEKKEAEILNAQVNAMLDAVERRNAALETAVKAGIERYGRLDVLFNNAGIGTGGAIIDMSFDDLDRVVEHAGWAVITGVDHAERAGGEPQRDDRAVLMARIREQLDRDPTRR